MSKRNNPEELIGFKEFIEHEKKDKRPNKARDSIRSYELMTFLDIEVTRLKKALHLFEEKAFMVKNYSQDTKIIVQQEGKNHQMKVDIIDELKDENSPIKKNLNELLTSHFNF